MALTSPSTTMYPLNPHFRPAARFVRSGIPRHRAAARSVGPTSPLGPRGEARANREGVRATRSRSALNPWDECAQPVGGVRVPYGPLQACALPLPRTMP